MPPKRTSKKPKRTSKSPKRRTSKTGAAAAKPKRRSRRASKSGRADETKAKTPKKSAAAKATEPGNNAKIEERRVFDEDKFVKNHKKSVEITGGSAPVNGTYKFIDVKSVDKHAFYVYENAKVYLVIVKSWFESKKDNSTVTKWFWLITDENVLSTSTIDDYIANDRWKTTAIVYNGGSLLRARAKMFELRDIKFKNTDSSNVELKL